MEKENKSFIQVPLEFKEDSFSEDDNFHYVSAYATTFDLDLGLDIVMPGATKRSLSVKKPKVLLHHDNKMPVGAHMEAVEDEKGVLIKCKIPKDGGNTPYLIPYLKCGAVNQLSIGYYTRKYENDKETGIRKIYDLDWEEYSFVTFPMNPNATVLDVKSQDGIINVRYLEKALRDVGLSQKESKALISGGISALKQRDADEDFQKKLSIEFIESYKQSIAILKQ